MSKQSEVLVEGESVSTTLPCSIVVVNERDDGKVQFHLKLGQLTTGTQQAFMRQLVSTAERVSRSGGGSRHEVLAALEKARRTNTM